MRTCSTSLAGTVLITVDSLRADAVFGPSGREIAPTLSSLAGRGAAFTDAVAPGNWTPFSFPGILASRTVFAGGDDVGLPDSPALAETLSSAGIETAGFNAANGFLTSHWGYDRGFDRFESFIDDPGSGIYGTYVTPHPTVQGWLQFGTAPFRRLADRLRWREPDRIVDTSHMLDVERAATGFVESAGEPFFLWLHYMDPHTPYVPAGKHRRAIGSDVGIARMLTAQMRAGLGRRVPDRALDALRALYHGSVHQADDSIRRVLDALGDRGIRDETCVIVAGDHGEAFGEHGRWQHDNVLYQEVAKVPWLIYDPSRSGEEGRLKRPVQLFDLVPTVADTLGYRIRGGDYPGRSVFRRGEPRTLFFSCFYQARCLGAFHGGYKYHYHYGTRPEELFYLPEDPGETTNLADEQPKRTASFRHAVLQWEKSVEKMYKRAMEDELRGRVGREKPSLEHTGRASLGASVSIVGYELEPDPPRAGSTARVRVAYHARSAPARDRMLVYTLRIGDRTEQLENHRPLDGLHPVSQWETGQYVVDEVEIDLPKEASGQTVSLAITLVEPGGDTGEKHPKTGIGGPVGGRNYQGVARVKLWDRQLGE